MKEKHGKESFFSRLWKGDLDLRELGFYLLYIISLYGITILIAQILYPGEYTPLENHISDQGGIVNNPRGHVYFNTGVVIVGISLVPYIYNIFKRFLPTMKRLTYIAYFFTTEGAIAFCFVGLIPQDYGTPHDIAADMAFGGFTLGALFTLPVLIKKIINKEKWPKPSLVLGYYFFFFFMITLGSFMLSHDPTDIPLSLDPRLFTWPPWQWTSMLLLFSWLIMLYFFEKIPRARE